MTDSTGFSDNMTINIDDYLSAGRSVTFKPTGSSMYPLFVPEYRDSATVMPVREFIKCCADEALATRNPEAFPSLASLGRGDVALYRRADGMLVLHRIHHVKKDKTKGELSFFMVGDHQKELEGPLPSDCVRGLMTEFTRKGRSHSVRNPGYILLSRLWLHMRCLRLPLISLLHKIKLLFR